MKCNFCKSNIFSEVLEHYDNNCYVDKDMYQLVKCKKCSLVTIENKPEPKALAKYYENNYYSYDTGSSIFFRMKKAWVKRVSKFPNKIANTLLLGQLYILPKNKEASVLDIGCGDGSALLSLKELGWKDLYGTEIDPEQCKKLEEKNIKTFNLVDILDIKVKAETFDLIRMSHTLEHMYNPNEAMEKSFELLKNGGSLLIAVPNFDSLASRIFGKYFCGLQLPTHLYHFNKKVLIQMVEDKGFVVEKVFTNGYSGFAYSLLTLMKDKYKIKLNSKLEIILTLAFVPLELVLNFFGVGFILTFKAIKK